MIAFWGMALSPSVHARIYIYCAYLFILAKSRGSIQRDQNKNNQEFFASLRIIVTTQFFLSKNESDWTSLFLIWQTQRVLLDYTCT